MSRVCNTLIQQYGNGNFIDDSTASRCQPKHKRHRNVIWFNPPYSKNVKTNIGRTFLQLVDKHFPKSSHLHKIFNRNSIKISYSCLNNVKTTIKDHNTKIRSTQQPETSTDNKCNCRNNDECMRTSEEMPDQSYCIPSLGSKL